MSTPTVVNSALHSPESKPAATGVVDCDIHPSAASPAEIWQYLPERWKKLVATYGTRLPNQPTVNIVPYPRMSPGNGMRMDAWPPNGGFPASDLDFMREQLLDACAIEFGIFQPLSGASMSTNLELGAALSIAMNEWQLEKWTRKDHRLKAGICVPQEDPEASVAIIERFANNRDFVHIAVPTRTMETFGRKRYWPIFEAAERWDLPICMHPPATGYHCNTPSGWASYYLEEHVSLAHPPQTVATSMIMEGVFERFPRLKIVLVEGGFAWVPPLAWRMDNHWQKMRDEVPQVKRPPSEYLREHFWFTTQPVEESEKPSDLLDTIRWIGADRLMFSTDYPHWDFDDPKRAFKVELSSEDHQAIFRNNAVALFRLQEKPHEK
jgi:predicted TIM-barrel fold metal-dependent hydrolase